MQLIDSVNTVNQLREDRCRQKVKLHTTNPNNNKNNIVLYETNSFMIRIKDMIDLFMYLYYTKTIPNIFYVILANF